MEFGPSHPLSAPTKLIGFINFLEGYYDGATPSQLQWSGPHPPYSDAIFRMEIAKRAYLPTISFMLNLFGNLKALSEGDNLADHLRLKRNARYNPDTRNVPYNFQSRKLAAHLHTFRLNNFN